MRKLAKFISVSVCLALTLAMAGCSSQKEVRAWPLATASPEDTVTQLYAEKFASEVDRLSGGSMKIEVYPNSTLGGDRDLLESCADGDIPFVVQNTAPQVTFMEDLAVFDIPCAFESMEECREVIDGPSFKQVIDEVYEDGGYRLLGIADQGFRVMSTNKPVYEIEDFEGQKIRTMENSYHLAFWSALGASPTPMSFAEVYIGLQQHTIDAQENPYEVIVSNRLFEQQKYVVETNHLPHLITLITSDAFFNDLTKEQREILMKAAATATEYARQQSDERISDRKAQIEAEGTEILPVSDELRQKILEKSAGVKEKIHNCVDPEVFEAYAGESK